MKLFELLVQPRYNLLWIELSRVHLAQRNYILFQYFAVKVLEWSRRWWWTELNQLKVMMVYLYVGPRRVLDTMDYHQTTSYKVSKKKGYFSLLVLINEWTIVFQSLSSLLHFWNLEIFLSIHRNTFLSNLCQNTENRANNFESNRWKDNVSSISGTPCIEANSRNIRVSTPVYYHDTVTATM